MGQILSDEGNQDEAINCLIDALRWDSRNHWALLMMGNIFAKFKKDVPTAMKYYDQALMANPSDALGITNIGYLLFQENKLAEAKKYAQSAIQANSEYPNGHFLLALIAAEVNDLQTAFSSCIKAVKANANKDMLHKNSVNQAFDVAKRMIAGADKTLFREYLRKLEFEGGTKIDVVEDTEIPTTAKIEFAENYNRPKHLVRFKPHYPAVEHLILHELVHLDFVIQARKQGLNKLVTATSKHKAIFLESIKPTLDKLKNREVPESKITLFGNALFDGLNLQAYNMPIDLFIEDFLYNEFPALRPFQFLSLYGLLQEGVKGCTDAHVLDISPPKILSVTKVFNLLNAMQFQRLFGIDCLNDFKATPAELRKAEALNAEFLEYKDNRKPAEEYKLVQQWAADLQIDAFFELEDEIQYRKKQDVDTFLTQLQQDPFGINQPEDPDELLAMAQFQETQEAIGTNMAVTMFMVDALQYFKDLPIEEVKKIAFEIAMIGQQGIDTETKNYIVGSIPNKRFSGYQLLAYYYVSWKLAIPEHVSELGLDYCNEFGLAKKMSSA
jgi:tetratricopeptide (TPR) repeat protein